MRLRFGVCGGEGGMDLEGVLLLCNLVVKFLRGGGGSLVPRLPFQLSVARGGGGGGVVDILACGDCCCLYYHTLMTDFSRM